MITQDKASSDCYLFPGPISPFPGMWELLNYNSTPTLSNRNVIIITYVILNFVIATLRKVLRRDEISLKNHFIDLLKDNDDIILYGTLDDRQGAVVSLNVKNMDSSEVSYILSDEFDIYTRPGFHCAPLAHKSLGTDELGAIRFSFGYFNTIEEVEQCANALKNIIERNKK